MSNQNFEDAIEVELLQLIDEDVTDKILSDYTGKDCLLDSDKNIEICYKSIENSN